MTSDEAWARYQEQLGNKTTNEEAAIERAFRAGWAAAVEIERAFRAGWAAAADAHLPSVADVRGILCGE